MRPLLPHCDQLLIRSAHQCEQISSKPLWKDARRWWEDSVYTWCSNHGKSCRSSLGSAGLGRSNQVNGIFSLKGPADGKYISPQPGAGSAVIATCCEAWLKSKWCDYHTWICLKAFHIVSLCIHFAQCRLVIACPGLRVGHHLATLVPLAITSVIPFRFHGLDSSTPWLRCCWRPWEVTLRWPRPSGLLFVVYQCLSVKFNVWLYRYYMILSCE